MSGGCDRPTSAHRKPLESRGSAAHLDVGAARVVPRLLPPSVPQRPRLRVGAVPRRGRPDADLRRHARREFCARLAVHARRVLRLYVRQCVGGRGGPRGAVVLAGPARRSARRRADRRAGRAPPAEAFVRCARTDAADGDVCRRSHHSRRGAVPLGCRGSARSARTGICGNHRNPRPFHSAIRPVPHRRRTCGAGRA